MATTLCSMDNGTSSCMKNSSSCSSTNEDRLMGGGMPSSAAVLFENTLTNLAMYAESMSADELVHAHDMLAQLDNRIWWILHQLLRKFDQQHDEQHSSLLASMSSPLLQQQQHSVNGYTSNMYVTKNDLHIHNQSHDHSRSSDMFNGLCQQQGQVALSAAAAYDTDTASILNSSHSLSSIPMMPTHSSAASTSVHHFPSSSSRLVAKRPHPTTPTTINNNNNNNSNNHNYMCKVCGRHFAQGGTVARHIRTMHSAELWPEVCLQCGRRFVTRSQLNGHVCSPADAASLQDATNLFSHNTSICPNVSGAMSVVPAQPQTTFNNSMGQ